MCERKGKSQQLTSSVAGIGNKERCRVAVRCDVEAASQSTSPMQGGAHSLSSCGDEGGLAGLKLMAIKTPLAPHPIHYEQHCRRRRSSLVLPVPAFLASLGPGLGSLGGLPGRHKVGSRGQGFPRHAGTAGAPAPPHRAHRSPFRAPSFQILPPTDASTASSQGRRAAGVAELPSRPCPFHIDWAVSTAPTVAYLQRRRSGSFTCFCQKICPVLCRARPVRPVFTTCRSPHKIAP